MESYHYNLVPLLEIRRFWRYRRQLGIWSSINLFGNVAVFVPFGFFEPMASRHRSFWGTICDGLFFSMVVEVFQLVTKVGRFDVDDLILNTLGVGIGYLLFRIGDAIRRMYGAKGIR